MTSLVAVNFFFLINLIFLFYIIFLYFLNYFDILTLKINLFSYIFLVKYTSKN